MPNIKSQKDRVVQAAAEQAHNKAIKTNLKTVVKKADAVVDAAKQGKFLSKDDFRDRTKVSKTVIDLMDDLKLFGDIPQSISEYSR